MKGKYLKKSKRNPLMVALMVVLSVLLLILLAGGIYLAVLMGQVNYVPDQGETLSSSEIEELLNRQPTETADPTAPTVKGEDVLTETGPAQEIVSTDTITILLIGQDRRPGESRARSDVMMLCTINPNTKTLTLSSIMRDLYVPIPGYQSNRINVPYVLGGMDLLKKTIKHNFGVTVDGCVEVDFNGFMDVVELLGGVDMELTQEEAEHLNYNEDYYDFPEEDWHLKAGMNHLNAKQTLAYSRVRNVGGNSDFGRTERQRKVIAAIISKMKTMSVGQLNDLLMTGAGLVTTDMSRTKLLNTAMSMMPLLSDLKVNTLQIPASDAYYDANVEGIGMVLIGNMEKNRALLAALYE